MTNQNTKNFIREPNSIKDGIPIFSLDDQYVENYKNIAHDHIEAMRRTGNNPFIQEKLWIELENSTKFLVNKYIPDGAKVLDAGVGLGRILANETRLQRYGIDISHEYLQEAKKKGFNVAFSRIEDMPFPDDYFDAVVACDVLEHVIDLHACCLQLIRVLKPGGVLILRVPNLDDMSAYLDESLPYKLVHLRSFDLSSLKILFGKIYGMQFKEHSYTGHYLKDSLLKVKFLSKKSNIDNLENKILPSNNFLRILIFLDYKNMIGRFFPKVKEAKQDADLLKKVLKISHEDFRRWIFRLRDSDPKLLEELLPEFVEPLEVNVVFDKQ